MILGSEGQGSGAHGHHSSVRFWDLLTIFGTVKDRHFVFGVLIVHNKASHDKLPSKVDVVRVTSPKFKVCNLVYNL